MIYIFEDRSGRRNNNQDTIFRNSAVVKFAKFDIKPQQNLADFIVEKFGDADCILFHKSYSVINTDASVGKIQEAFRQILDGNFILFSGGTERGSINSQGDISVNADVMYENLDLFLRTFRETGKPIYEILIWGENYTLNQNLTKQINIHVDNFLEENLFEPVDSDKLEDVIENIENEGFDIEEMVNWKADAHGGIVTLGDVCNIVQSKID